MRKKLRRAYLYLDNRDYGRIEAELNTYVACFKFCRGLTINQISYLEWDIYGLQLNDRSVDSIWEASYHTLKCAQYFPGRLFLIIDRFTWGFFESPTPNMVLMDQPNWPNMILNHMEIR